MELIPTKTAELKDLPPPSASKAEELTPEQKEDINSYMDDPNDPQSDYDYVEEFEF